MAHEAARVKKEEKMRKSQISPNFMCQYLPDRWKNALEKSRSLQMEKKRRAKEYEQEMGKKMAAYSEKMFEKLSERADVARQEQATTVSGCRRRRERRAGFP